jgi:hypothetical protein
MGVPKRSPSNGELWVEGLGDDEPVQVGRLPKGKLEEVLELATV